MTNLAGRRKTEGESCRTSLAQRMEFSRSVENQKTPVGRVATRRIHRHHPQHKPAHPLKSNGVLVRMC